jgi:formate dehydrogenase subunit delta
MSKDQVETLRRFADQIAKNFMALGHDKAVLATADHIDMFWDPRMKEKIFADDRSKLTPVAAAAIDHLAEGNHPEHQTRATKFNTKDEVGRVDAG